jgi:hypothetical protein
LVTFYTLFVIELRSRSVHVCGTTVSPNGHWMRQVARQLVGAADGFALGKTHLIIDRDTKYADGSTRHRPANEFPDGFSYVHLIFLPACLAVRPRTQQFAFAKPS